MAFQSIQTYHNDEFVTDKGFVTAVTDVGYIKAIPPLCRMGLLNAKCVTTVTSVTKYDLKGE